MSLLNKLVNKQKTPLAESMGVKNEPKAEAHSAEPDSKPTGKVGSEASGAQGVVAQKVPSILGTLGSRADRNVEGQAPGNLGESVGSNAAEVVPVESAPAPKKSLLAAIAAREQTERAKENFDHLFEAIPEDFQQKLDFFDELMSRDQGSLDFNLNRARDFVKKIMIELKENPEYDGMIIARDVHNIIAFQRRLKDAAQATISTKVEKAAKKAAKPKGADRFSLDLDSIDLGAKPPKSLQDLSNLDIEL